MFESTPNNSNTYIQDDDGGGGTTTTTTTNRRTRARRNNNNNHHDALQANNDPDQAWLSRLLEWHQLTLENKESSSNGGGRKSRFKRPREVPAYPDLRHSGAGVVQPLKRMQWENAEGFLLEYVRSDVGVVPDNIPIEQKTWDFYVRLSGGRAMRALKKRKRDGELDSWAKTPVSTFPMHGDFRSSQVERSDPLLPPSASSRSVAKTWEAVLAAARAFDKHLSDVTLDTLLDFFDHVRRLPSPSQCLDETTRIASSVIECLNKLWKECSEARLLRAQWMDLWYEEGVDIEAIRKVFKSVSILVPDEFSELQRQVDIVDEWQTRLNDALAAAAEDDPDLQRDDVPLLESLALEAKKAHGFRCKSFVALQMKLEKVYDMRTKLNTWWADKCTEGCTVRTIGSMVREVLRMKVRFTEGNFLLRFSQDVDSWVERADIAIRSRMSLKEVETLIERGLEFHLDLSEYLEKLQSRVEVARSWLASVGEVVPLEDTNLEWMAKVRGKLEEGRNTELHDLACEGSRLPVEVDFVQMIHVELEARQWSAKAGKWLDLPGKTHGTSKQGKIEELRDHLKKAADLRERLPSSDRSSWQLVYESELADIVDKADMWFGEQFDRYFGGDHRKASSKRSISIYKLRQIDHDANAIPVNLGTAHAKVTRYLVQAETWYQSHQKLLLNAGVETPDSPSESLMREFVSLDQLKKAMDDANKSISFDLEEVEKLDSLIERLETWFEQVAIATATGKRRFRGKKSSYTLDEIEKLVDEASRLPLDTTEAIEAIRECVSSVSAWQKEVVSDFVLAAKAVRDLTLLLDQMFGMPSSFLRKAFVSSKECQVVSLGDAEPAKQDADSSMDVSEPILPECTRHLQVLEKLVERVIRDMISSNITTPEMDVIANLDALSRWLSRSIKYLTTNDEIFDKRFYGAFDRFVSEGKDLQQFFANTETSELIDVSRRAIESQLCRMKILLEERNEFFSWSEQVDKVLSGEDKRCTIDKLRELDTKSQRFPDENDHVKRIRDLTEKTNDWTALAKRSINSSVRLKMAELKAQIDEGDRLGIMSGELRELKNGLKAARSWANRVKKCKPELCTAETSEVNALVDDYETLMVEMPEEIARLNQAIKHFCICRGPHSGHMILCEECQDSFHATCLGMSKVRAEKLERYVCIRCSLKKIFRSSSSTIAGIVKKWTSDKELHKARQIEFQKYQRKSRKECKELEKQQKVYQEVTDHLANLEQRRQDTVKPSEASPLTSVAADTSEAVEALLSIPSITEKGTVALPTEPQQTTTIVVPIPGDSLVNALPNPENVLLDQGQAQAGSNAVDGMASTVSEPKDCAGKEVEKTGDKRELLSKLDKATRAIEACQTRLKALELGEEDRKKRELFENSQAAQIQQWCMLVRNVVAPRTTEEVAEGQPSRANELSNAMERTIVQAQTLAIDKHVDVQTVHNAFKCICWASKAMDVFRRQPKAKAIADLVTAGQRIKLPEEKSLKFLRGISQRVDSWNARYKKALDPLPGETDNIPMNELKELAAAADRIPVSLRYEHRLENVIEDNGARYCLCGGVSDGRFMVGCDKCERWFHGCCVGVSGDAEVERWFCPPCNGMVVDPTVLVQKFHDAYEEVDVVIDMEDDDGASKAPDPKTLWPPFGLKETPAVLDAMGMEISFTEAEVYSAPKSTDVAVIVSSGSENTDGTSPNHNLKPAPEESCREGTAATTLQNLQPTKDSVTLVASKTSDQIGGREKSSIDLEAVDTARLGTDVAVSITASQPSSSSSSAVDPMYSIQIHGDSLSANTDSHGEVTRVPPVRG
jgi:hypothetical protein